MDGRDEKLGGEGKKEREGSQGGGACAQGEVRIIVDGEKNWQLSARLDNNLKALLLSFLVSIWVGGVVHIY